MCLVVSALASACAQPYAPPAVVPTQENLDRASRTLQEAAARRDDVRLEEGGLVLLAHTYEWREVEVYGAVDRIDAQHQNYRLPEPSFARDRVVVGPRPFRVSPANLKQVRIQPYLSGVTLELVLEGEPEPIFLSMDDAAEAETLGEALDLLRRAGAEPAPAP